MPLLADGGGKRGTARNRSWMEGRRRLTMLACEQRRRQHATRRILCDSAFKAEAPPLAWGRGREVRHLSTRLTVRNVNYLPLTGPAVKPNKAFCGPMVRSLASWNRYRENGRALSRTLQECG
jgi:hypothetical protein